ncbi:MAG: dihydroorotate dehydrogenase [Eubacteriales bacterium]|jgi:dihydroorotate dehydrogenase (NAD+) catalytic subunit|nr:dihydroorotate dehydrogenase [Eubacteriales bacterium]
MINLEVDIAGVKLKNPIITASGTFANGREISEYYDLCELGAVCVKAITLEPRRGNKPPRIAETPSGILNSVGLQNAGLAYFMKYEIPFLRKYDTKIIANISGCTIEENCEIAKRLGNLVDLIELNVSCPNVKEGGVAFGTNPKITKEITKRVKENCAVPLIVKLSPNVTDIKEIAKAAEEGGADALSLINTILGMQIDVNTRRPTLANNTGGLSGPAVKPVAVRMAWEVSSITDLPIIGMGGIMSGEDVAEFMLAGATAVAVGTANLVNPTACVDIKKEFINYLDENNIDDVHEIIKAVKIF